MALAYPALERSRISLLDLMVKSDPGTVQKLLKLFRAHAESPGTLPIIAFFIYQSSEWMLRDRRTPLPPYENNPPIMPGKAVAWVRAPDESEWLRVSCGTNGSLVCMVDAGPSYLAHYMQKTANFYATCLLMKTAATDPICRLYELANQDQLNLILELFILVS
jgi:hypothetical protein